MITSVTESFSDALVWDLMGPTGATRCGCSFVCWMEQGSSGTSNKGHWKFEEGIWGHGPHLGTIDWC